jgi:S1-C subfamily serine protease
MNGRPWSASGWPALPIGRSEDIVPGEEVWVIGYPDVGGSTIHVTAGKVSGFSGEQGGAGRNFIKTDAAITHGNSGGTAVDAEGMFIGVPTAFRVKTEDSGGGTIATVGNVGLIRPVELARDMIGIAQAGWTPKEGDNAVAPVGPVEPVQPAQAAGVTISSKVVDADNGEAVRGAFVVVFKAGIRVADVDRAKLDEQALTWGQTNNRGEFTLNQPVPRGSAYAVAVLAKGYQPLAVDDILRLSEKEPDRYDPWGIIRIERE